MPYFVISGYHSPDHYTSEDGPVLIVQECSTEAEVLILRQRFEEDHGQEAYETSDRTFQVIEGVERIVLAEASDRFVFKKKTR